VRFSILAILPILIGCQKLPLETKSYPILFKLYYMTWSDKSHIQILPPDSVHNQVRFLVTEMKPMFRFDIINTSGEVYEENTLLKAFVVKCPEDTVSYQYCDVPIFNFGSAGVITFVQKDTPTSARLFQVVLGSEDTLTMSGDETLNIGKEDLFTLTKPDTFSRMDWIPCIHGPILLENDQESPQALINVGYGFLDTPDQVVILESVFPWKVAATINLANIPNCYELADINRDGEQELIMASGGCGTNRKYGGQNSSVAYCYAADLKGKLLWTFAADTAGGPVSLFVVEEPAPRLFFIQQCHNFLYGASKYTNLYELEPATGKVLRHKRINGLGEFSHSDQLDSAHFVLVADISADKVYWLNCDFNAEGNTSSVPGLSYITTCRAVNVGASFPILYPVALQGGNLIWMDDDLKPMAFSEFSPDINLDNQPLSPLRRQIIATDTLTIIRARDKEYRPCFIYAARNPYWWLYRYRWAMTVIVGFIAITGGGYFGYKFWLKRREHQRNIGIWQQFMSPQLIQLFKEHDPRREPINFHLDVTILNTDLRNFTAYSESAKSPEIVIDTLSPYYEHTAEEVSRQGGVMDKFMGDGAMALFGVPPWLHGERRNQPHRALNVCEALFDRFGFMKSAWREKGYQADRVGLGFGIATGRVIFGTIGRGKRLDLTVIGSAANLSARLCTLALDGEVIMDESSYAAVRQIIGNCEAFSCTNIKGFKSLTLYRRSFQSAAA
jgi:class 3 adenylate cyclase